MSQSPERLKLLVPIESSESSRRALAWAFDYATRVPCETHVLHVVEQGHQTEEEVTLEVDRITRQTEEELMGMLPTAAERARVLPLHRHLVMGKAAEQILRVANEIGAETIVIGGGNPGRIATARVGSTTYAVMRAAECPVVCVKVPKAA